MAKKMHNVILACLALSPMTGFSLRKFISNAADIFPEVSFGALYPALSQLEKKRSISVIPDNTRKIYALTDAGRRQVDKWLEAQDDEFKRNYELATRLFFFTLLEPEATPHDIETFLTEFAQEQTGLELVNAEEATDAVEQADVADHTAALPFGVEFYNFLVGWHRENQPVAAVAAKQAA